MKPLHAVVFLIAVAPAVAGTVTGRVTVSGKVEALPQVGITLDKAACGEGTFDDPRLVVSERGEVENAVAVLLGEVPGSWPAGPYVLDQKRCRFDPHVVVVPVGKALEVRNSDGILHNFHTFSKDNPASNLGQPPTLPVLEKVWKRPEAFRVECDVHYWMSAFVVVVENPYFAVTTADGTFSIEGVPAGQHTVAVVHERLGRTVATVTVPAEGSVNVELTLAAGGEGQQ